MKIEAAFQYARETGFPIISPSGERFIFNQRRTSIARFCTDSVSATMLYHTGDIIELSPEDIFGEWEKGQRSPRIKFTNSKDAVIEILP